MLLHLKAQLIENYLISLSIFDDFVLVLFTSAFLPKLLGHSIGTGAKVNKTLMICP